MNLVCICVQYYVDMYSTTQKYIYLGVVEGLSGMPLDRPGREPGKKRMLGGCGLGGRGSIRLSTRSRLGMDTLIGRIRIDVVHTAVGEHRSPNQSRVGYNKRALL